jgi:hypothetical protein
MGCYCPSNNFRFARYYWPGILISPTAKLTVTTAHSCNFLSLAKLVETSNLTICFC